jgi:hypothetical protein
VVFDRPLPGWRHVVGACALALVGADAHAQAAPPQSRAGGPAPAAAAAPAPVDVSLGRIRRMLRETPPTPAAKSSLLKLQYYVEVVGNSPRIDLLKDYSIHPATAVQYGGMTHAEFLKVTAPFWRK